MIEIEMIILQICLEKLGRQTGMRRHRGGGRVEFYFEPEHVKLE